MQRKTFKSCEDGDILLVSLAAEADTRDPAELILRGESSTADYGEADALAEVSSGRAERVMVVKVLAVVERTAQVVPARRVKVPEALIPPASVFYRDPKTE